MTELETYTFMEEEEKMMQNRITWFKKMMTSKIM